MRISSSNIGMESARKYSSTRKEAFSLTLWSGARKLSSEDDGQLEKAKKNPQDKNAKEDILKNSTNNLMNRYTEIRTKSGIDFKAEKEAMARIKEDSLMFLLQILFRGMSGNAQGTSSGGAALEYKEEYYYSETESTSFETSGTVVTAEGKEISFNLGFEMSRSFEEYYRNEIKIGTPELCDPLVINLNTNIATVSDQKFLFDIDADGTEDNISMLNQESGYLALDLNNDGKINDGNELFGTKSGNGFKDLEKYDSDGNGWIDEGDDIWSKLLIWTKNANGEDELCKVFDKDVGAIYLGNVSTDFSLNKKSDNATNAVIRNTGVFLYENGQAGTVQHLDLAK